jgi:crossover junction endodeoxyribonuclease RuvC
MAKHNTTKPAPLHPPKPRLVLGIDPGTRLMGYGVVLFDPMAASVQKQLKYVEHGVIKASSGDVVDRLREISLKLNEITARLSPDVLVIEQAFVSHKLRGGGIQAAMRLGEARGVVLSAVGASVAQILQYSPKEVKQGVAGSGSADKEQVGRMVLRILGRPDLEKALVGATAWDATDALALAVHAALSGLRVDLRHVSIQP